MRVIIDSSDYEHLPVNSDPDILGGKPVFTGTRVPLEALWNNLADGASLDDFLAWFPTVTREQANAVLSFTFRLIAAAA
jgi:uncharacterized protein (DUF433 family)